MGSIAQGMARWRHSRRWPGVLPAALIGVGCNALDFLNQPEGLAIQRFAAAPATIVSGGTAALSWDVEGAETVQIEGIGTVAPKGLRQVSPSWSTTYVLTARAGTASVTATFQVAVQSGPSPSPTPSGSPTPNPNPSVTPTPTSSPSPSPSNSASPSPVPTDRPSPSPTPVSVTCGVPAPGAGNCPLTVLKPTVLPAGQCIELNRVTTSLPCPIGLSTVQSLTFRVTAHTSRGTLIWRRAGAVGDVFEPATGTVTSRGQTDVTLSDIVLDDRARIEVVSGEDVLLRFVVRHY